jgi:hypothetical protein
MSTTETQDIEMGPTKPVKEHEWLKNFVGDWKTESTMTMPDGSQGTSTGTETVKDFGGLWAFGEGEGTMPDGDKMEYKTGLGYDVSFKGYRGFWIANVSSHLWKYEGELSADGKVMTLNCEGPDMMVDGKTANYRDVHTLIDRDHRKMESFAQQEDGSWVQFMTVNYSRA